MAVVRAGACSRPLSLRSVGRGSWSRRRLGLVLDLDLDLRVSPLVVLGLHLSDDSTRRPRTESSFRVSLSLGRWVGRGVLVVVASSFAEGRLRSLSRDCSRGLLSRAPFLVGDGGLRFGRGGVGGDEDEDDEDEGDAEADRFAAEALEGRRLMGVGLVWGNLGVLAGGGGRSGSGS